MKTASLLALLLLASGCSAARAGADAGAPDAGEGDAQPPADAAPADAAPDAGVDKSAACASSFGNELTNAFGRVDGTVLAVVPPTNTKCALPNSTHLVLQLTMHAATYRMVVNVFGAGADPRISFLEKPASLPAPAFSEGWHPGAKLDYVTTLGVASGAFTPMDQATVVDAITSRIDLGAHVSVYATSSGGSFAESAHLVHRNKPDADGAIVIGPDTASPRFLLFHFADQTF